MDIVLAKILGLYFLLMGLAFIFNPKRLRDLYEATLKSDTVLIFGGVTAILLGAVIVALHNVWVFGWPVIITLLGWWSLIKGFGIVVCPRFASLFSFMLQKPESFYRGIGVVLSLLGLFLTYHGWINALLLIK